MDTKEKHAALMRAKLNTRLKNTALSKKEKLSALNAKGEQGQETKTS
jgi:hypothetical protein